MPEQDTNDNTNTELTAGWTSIDADGDGYQWYHLTGNNPLSFIIQFLNLTVP